MSESTISLLIKKILYHSTHRGSRENDLILGQFAQKYVTVMSESELKDFSLILEESDENLYQYLTKKKDPPTHLDSNIMRKLLNFNVNQ